MYIKTQEEIEYLKEGGKILGEILEKLSGMARSGINAYEIDKKAEEMIKKAGGVPSFKGFQSNKKDPPFPSTVCFSVNEELVHGIATKDKILRESDILSLDIGMQYPKDSGKGQGGNGFFTDTSITLPVGKVSRKKELLLEATREALEIGIGQSVAGNTIADIGQAIEDYIEPKGYGIVRDLVGHGVGHGVHEEPRIPNFYTKNSEKWILEPGVVIAIEPMITLGGYKIGVADDGWSISTLDKSLCAHFEHTIVVTEGEPLVITRRPNESF